MAGEIAMESWKTLQENQTVFRSVRADRNLQTDRLVRLSAALGTLEQVLLDVVADREERAACRVRRSVLAVGASDAASERSCQTGESGLRS